MLSGKPGLVHWRGKRPFTDRVFHVVLPLRLNDRDRQLTPVSRFDIAFGGAIMTKVSVMADLSSLI
ncbi:MAG: hypothetical protein EBT13_07455 [Rhodobacteraceae bacterium]|nr:hypothetical protein [Paracoccaceae bacterium]